MRKAFLKLQATFLLGSSLSSASVQSKLLVRKIQSKPNDIQNALDVLTQIEKNNVDSGEEDGCYNKKDDGPYLAALRVCGKSNNPDIAVQIYNQHPSPACETMMISVLGATGQYQRAVDLLLQSTNRKTNDKQSRTASSSSSSSTGSFNAALAACGKSKDWNLALDIYENHMPTEQITTLTENIVLNVLSDCRQGGEAIRVLNAMSCQPDRVTYQYVFSALTRSEMIDDACTLLGQLRQDIDGIQPSDDMYDLVVAAYGKMENWDGIQNVERIRYPNATTTISEDDTKQKHSFQYVENLKKVGKGKEAYREVAMFLPENLTIGIQPNRNPSKNGIRLVFYQNSVDDQKPTDRVKLGYLLMINNDNSSSLLGMYLNTQERGRGIAKVCLATWLWFCLNANIEPKTGVMKKPLISLMLQHRFYFIPRKGGIEIEVASDPNDPDRTLVYASSKKSLEGAFCPRDLQHQSLSISVTPPNPRGRMVSVKTTLKAPDTETLQELVSSIIPDEAMDCPLTPSEIRLMYLGK